MAARESSLRPNERDGKARGIFQITPKRQADLGLSREALYNPNVVVGAVAGAMAEATKKFHGNSDLAIASWTTGVDGVERAYATGGMDGVRNLLLDRKHPSYGRVGDYMDFVKRFERENDEGTNGDETE